MYLVCGIHGSGKTVYCQSMKKKMGLPCYSASELINKTIAIQQVRTKNIDRINERQDALINEVDRLEKVYGEIILDGHLCLINKDGNVERIPQEVFMSFHISEIRVLKSDENEIQRRMKERDGIDWSLEYIEAFQTEEINYAKELSELCNVELKIIDTSKKDNILLPISPVYADKILNGEKTYEFRKKLSKKEIKKIYIYATSPIKKIIGEAEVLSRVSREKNDLWESCCDKAGVTHDFYLKYFSEQSEANAYIIGETMKYCEAISLEDVGILYVPQSHVYVREI